MKLNTLWHLERTYITALSIEECLNHIKKEPLSFGANPHNPEHYTFEQLSDYQISVVFRGREYGGTKRTKFLVTFYKANQGSVIHMQFQKELLGFPPLTPTQVLDCFAKERFGGNILND